MSLIIIILKLYLKLIHKARDSFIQLKITKNLIKVFQIKDTVMLKKKC